MNKINYPTRYTAPVCFDCRGFGGKQRKIFDMNNVFKERIGCAFMSWEQDAKKRNKNTRTCFNVLHTQEVNVGDILIGSVLEDKSSCYEIVEIIERRESKLSKRHYVVAKTKYALKKNKFGRLQCGN